MARVRVRPARADDLAGAAAVWHASEGHPGSAPPSPSATGWLRHVLATGRLVVAETDTGRVIGFAGARPEGALTALTDLFVHPGHQSSGVGGLLLDAVLPTHGPRATFASADRRALGLYLRRGLLARWPAFYLAAGRDAVRLPDRDLQTREVDMVESQFLVQGPADPGFWAEAGAIALEVRDRRRALGHAMLTWHSPEWLHQPELATILESSAVRGHAADVVVAVIRAVLARGAAGVALQVPGAHPALPILLGAGLRIAGVDILCATADCGVADPERTTVHGEPLPPI